MRRLLSVANLAALLGRSVRWVYDARYRGSDLPPGITVGSRLYFHADDVEEWLAAKRDRARRDAEERRRNVHLSSERPRAFAKRGRSKSLPLKRERVSDD